MPVIVSRALPTQERPNPGLRSRCACASRLSSSDELTRALAQGADPAARPELALRARQLTRRRNRRAVACLLRKTVAVTHSSPLARSAPVPISRRAVREAEDLIAVAINRLRAPGSIRVQGVAMLDQIITNGESSPLYNVSIRGTLRRQIAAALQAMDVSRPTAHEFPLD